MVRCEWLMCLFIQLCASKIENDFKRLAVRDNVGNHFSEVIVDALNRYYVKNHSATMVMRLSTISPQTYHLQSDIMDEIMERTSHSIAYEFRSSNNRTRRPRIFNIAFIDGYGAFRQLFHALDPAYYDFSGYYLIVLTNFGKLLPETLERIFGFLWRLNVVNVNIITADLQDHSQWQSVLMYTYYPYQPNSCEKTFPILLHRFRKGQRLDHLVELFPNKLSNFHRCLVTVGTFHLPPFILLMNHASNDVYGGVEGDLLRALSLKLNFTVHLVEPHDGELWGTIVADSNNSIVNSTGCVGLVLSERVNLTVGRFAIRGDRNLWMKHSRSYYTVRMVFGVPAGREYTPFEKLFRPFARLTWLLLAFYLMIALVVIFVIRLGHSTKVRSFVYGRGVSTPALNLLNVLLGGALLLLPSRNFARTVLFLWMYYCLVLRSLYQGSLFEYLQERKNFSPLQTVEAIVREDYRVYSLQGSALYLQQMPNVLERTTWLPDDDALMEQYLHDLAVYKAPSVALFTDIERVAYYNHLKKRTGPVYVAGTVLVRFPIGIYYPKKSCLANQFDREIDGLLTSGLFTHQLQQYVNYDFFGRPAPHQNLPTPLTLDQLLGSYETLLGLLLSASILLLLELASRRFGFLQALFTFLQAE
ncbi:uncharacterized protein LOC128728324 [Anopheles nili]|uniref:uncharacterized protein LOC128728324 n=1 Tax=Anopheles nili TaxID=185578 RepID=UPI00237B050B|nr:uncharacterized protein LOC128728324 [Anopheles nili]